MNDRQVVYVGIDVSKDSLSVDADALFKKVRRYVEAMSESAKTENPRSSSCAKKSRSSTA